MFVPGFGIPGISGIALLIASVVLMWLKAGALAAVGLVVIIMALAAILLSVSLKSAANGRLSRSRFILKDRESAEEGYTAASDMNIFVGCEGEARTVLRPSGIVEFDGVRAQRRFGRGVCGAGSPGEGCSRGWKPHCRSQRLTGAVRRGFKERKG